MRKAKRVWIGLLTLLCMICCAFGLVACGGGSGGSNGSSGGSSSVKGTYYLYENGQYVKSNYITLDSDKWTDDDGEGGDYALSGESVTLYAEIFGEKEEFATGTVKNGVLTLNIMGEEIVYCKEGKAPSDGGQGGEKPSSQKYTVTVKQNDADAGTVTGTGMYNYDSNVTVTAMTNPGYTFIGWYNGETKLTDELRYTFTMPAENVTYTAKWIVCPVTMEANDNSAGNVSGLPSTTKLGEEITVTATTNPGYTFIGWYNGETKLTDKLSYTFTMPAENVTYTAKWIVCPVTMEANDNSAGNVSGLPSTTKLGEEITVTATTKAGYTFIGWYNGETKLTDELTYTFTMSAENVTYTAKWCKITIKSADTNAGTVSSLTGTYMPGDSVTVTATTNVGYTFIGWYNGDTKLTDELRYTFTMPAENVTYTAKWQIAEEMSGFHFTSTSLICTITGIKDKTVTDIVVPDYVTSISSGAFSGCSSLTSVTIENGVTSIGSSAFFYCRSLTSVTFKNPNGWKVSTTSSFSSSTTLLSSSLSNSSTAATYLTSTYYDYYYWKRS